MQPVLFASLTALLFATLAAPRAAETITVDFDRVTKTGVKPGAAGLNLCWLLDSDLRRQGATWDTTP